MTGHCFADPGDMQYRMWESGWSAAEMPRCLHALLELLVTAEKPLNLSEVHGLLAERLDVPPGVLGLVAARPTGPPDPAAMRFDDLAASIGHPLTSVDNCWEFALSARLVLPSGPGTFLISPSPPPVWTVLPFNPDEVAQLLISIARPMLIEGAHTVLTALADPAAPTRPTRVRTSLRKLASTLDTSVDGARDALLAAGLILPVILDADPDAIFDSAIITMTIDWACYDSAWLSVGVAIDRS